MLASEGKTTDFELQNKNIYKYPPDVLRCSKFMIVEVDHTEAKISEIVSEMGSGGFSLYVRFSKTFHIDKENVYLRYFEPESITGWRVSNKIFKISNYNYR